MTMNKFLCIVAVLAAVAIIGCSNAPPRDAPTTYPVTGVVLQGDGSPFAGGTLEFRPKNSSNVNTIGDIDETGHFALRTLLADGKVDGAPEGDYQVTITPLSQSQDQQMQSYVLKKTVKIRPGEKNELVLKIGE
jgi:hypothetical protein